MFTFISNQVTQSQATNNAYSTEDDIVTAEAIQGDAALILKVQELNDLRRFNDDVAA